MEKGLGHLSFLSVLAETGRGGVSYKLSVGGINVVMLVRWQEGGWGGGDRSMLVGVTVCSHCLLTATSGHC